jgi:hypothetical protein
VRLLLPAGCASTATTTVGKLGIPILTMSVNVCVVSLVESVESEQSDGRPATRRSGLGARVGRSTGLRRIRLR